MSFPLIPTIIVDKLTDVTPQMLLDRGIRFLMLDFDNTIVPYTTNDPTPEMEQWLQTMLQSEIGICVVSNSKRDRVVRFCEARGIPCITHSRKPFSKGIGQSAKRDNGCRSNRRSDRAYPDRLSAQAFSDFLTQDIARAGQEADRSPSPESARSSTEAPEFRAYIGIRKAP